MTTLPDWMLPGAPVEFPPAAGRRRGRNAVRRAVDGFTRLLGEMLTSEEVAARSGLLQGIDPRAKVLGLLGLIVAVTFVHRLWMLAAAYALCLLLAGLSRVPVRRLVQALLAVLAFSAVVALPAILNVVTPGTPLWTFWQDARLHVGPWQLPETLAVTDAGLLVAARFLLRAVVCVTLAALLASTTRAERLFRGLRALGVPQLFVMLLGMMQRYLGALLRAAEEIHLAKISRSIVPGSLRQEQGWVAAGLGALFRRTQRLGNDIYLAMLSRGYTGEVHLLDEPRWRGRDWAFLGGVVIVGALLIFFGQGSS
ncbi:MAG: cobalt ECF transporter T component CbiQ [Armatimonadota bacterium]